MVSTARFSLEDSNRVLREFDVILSKSFDERLIGTAEVATGTTDGAVSLGSIATAIVFIIMSDQTVTLNFNGADTDYTLTADTGGQYNGMIVFWNSSVTAVTVDNASGSTANLIYAAYGNA